MYSLKHSLVLQSTPRSKIKSMSTIGRIREWGCYMVTTGGFRGGGSRPSAPPPLEQNAVVLFLISNYEIALRKRHFPCQYSFSCIITLGAKVYEGFRKKIHYFYSRIYLFIFLFFGICSFLQRFRSYSLKFCSYSQRFSSLSWGFCP